MSDKEFKEERLANRQATQLELPAATDEAPPF
jgi:hypothetical protein